MLKCGFYEKEITPPLGCCIPGYYTPRIADGVVDKLYCRAFAVSNGENTIIRMSLDSISVHPTVNKGILERVVEYTGLDESNLSISAIHTHTGTPRMRPKDSGSLLYGDEEYDKWLIRVGADCMTLAYQSMEDAVIKYGTGYTDAIGFNRVYVMKDGRLQTAPEIGDPDVVRPHGPIDPEVSVIYVENKDGKPLGAMVNHACHPDVIKGTKYSADWPGVVVKRLKEKYGSDFVGIFFNGTCGNINHVDVINGKEYPPSSHYITMGNIVADEAIKAISSAEPIIGEEIASSKEYFELAEREWDMKRIAWAEHIVATVKPIEGLTLALGTGYQDQEDLLTAKGLLRSYNARQSKRMMTVQASRIGDVYFYNVPGEMWVQHGLYIKENSPSKKNVIAELSHGIGGYMPTKDAIADTVYESKMSSYPFEAGAAELIAEKAVKIAKEL